MTGPGLPPRLRDRAWWAVPLLALVLLAIRVLVVPIVPSDDAYISFRYAWNLVHGAGLAWNAGGPAVEGYSNLLWVLWCAVGLALGAPATAWSCAWGLAFSAGAVLAAAGAVRAAGGGRAAASAAALLVAGTPIFAGWAVRGLEGPLLGFLLVTGAWRTVVEDRALLAGRRPFPASALLFGLAAVTHVDGPLYLVVPVAARLAHLRRVRWDRHDALAALLLLAPVGAQFAVRLATIGDLLPTSFYAKFGERGGEHLVSYLRAILAWNPPLLLAWAAGSLLGIRGRRAVLAWPGLLGLLYVCVVRGDPFGDLRLVAPLVPVLSAAALAGLDLLRTRPARLAAFALLLAAFGRNAVVQSIQEGGRGAPTNIGYTWRIRGLPPPEREVPWTIDLLVRRLPEGDSFLYSDVGRVGYALVENPLLDGRGLSWRTVAHLRHATARGRPTGELPRQVIAEFVQARPALVFFQCNEAWVFGDIETWLAPSAPFREGWTFVARGEYSTFGDACVYARRDATPPPDAVVEARYARLAGRMPELDWAPSLAAWRSGVTLPDPGLAPLLSPPRGGPDRSIPPGPDPRSPEPAAPPSAPPDRFLPPSPARAGPR